MIKWESNLFLCTSTCSTSNCSVLMNLLVRIFGLRTSTLYASPYTISKGLVLVVVTCYLFIKTMCEPFLKWNILYPLQPSCNVYPFIFITTTNSDSIQLGHISYLSTQLVVIFLVRLMYRRQKCKRKAEKEIKYCWKSK